DALPLGSVQRAKQGMPQPAAVGQRQLQVFKYGVSLENGGSLELTPDSQGRHLMLGHFRKVAPITFLADQKDVSIIRTSLAGDDVHESCFSGTVGPDNAAQLTLV